MINETLKKYDISAAELATQMAETLGPNGDARLVALYDHSVQDLKPDKIVKGRVLECIMCVCASLAIGEVIPNPSIQHN